MTSTNQARGTISKLSFLSADKRLYKASFIVYFRALYQYISLQTLPELRSDFKKLRRKSHFAQVQFSTHMVNCICMYKPVHSKQKLKHTNTSEKDWLRSDILPPGQCYQPAVFFHLNALSFPEGKTRRAFQNLIT
jgi:hypothetical protein